MDPARQETPSPPVGLPADLELEDRLIGGLTARQVAILCAAGAVLYAGYTATRSLVPLVVFAVVAVPVAAAVAALVLGRRDGISLDRYAWFALRHLHNTRPESTPNPPEMRWVGPDPGRGGGPGGWWTRVRRPVAAAGLPVRDVGATAGFGVVDLGAAGLAVIAVVGSVSMSLRSVGEQEALVAVFARWLHSLSAATHILIRALPLDLTNRIQDLHDAAASGQLGHRALAAAAAEHARFLTELGEQHELLHRQVLLVLRELLPPGAAPSPDALARRDRAALIRLARRLGEAAELLAPAGLTVTALDAAQAAAVLDAACRAHLTGHDELTAERPVGLDDLVDADGEDPGWYPLSIGDQQC